MIALDGPLCILVHPYNMFVFHFLLSLSYFLLFNLMLQFLYRYLTICRNVEVTRRVYLLMFVPVCLITALNVYTAYLDGRVEPENEILPPNSTALRLFPELIDSYRNEGGGVRLAYYQLWVSFQFLWLTNEKPFKNNPSKSPKFLFVLVFTSSFYYITILYTGYTQYKQINKSRRFCQGVTINKINANITYMLFIQVSNEPEKLA